jgi:hypothetical protein
MPLRDRFERARAQFDLAITSVLLDAGAGPHWSYRDAATGAQVGRSEGLALASLAMFADGAFRAGNRLRRCQRARDADQLLGRHLQVSQCNPLPGVDGRAALLSAWRRRRAGLATFAR